MSTAFSFPQRWQWRPAQRLSSSGALRQDSGSKFQIRVSILARCESLHRTPSENATAMRASQGTPNELHSGEREGNSEAHNLPALVQNLICLYDVDSSNLLYTPTWPDKLAVLPK